MEATVELMTSQEAQNHFGKFSRKAQREIVIITNHSEPVFIAIPVRITASIAKFISETSPKTGEEVGQNMRKFFAELEAGRPPNPEFTEDEINQLIKSAND